MRGEEREGIKEFCISDYQEMRGKGREGLKGMAELECKKRKGL